MEMSTNVDAISAALSKAQAKMQSAKKDESGYGYKYSDLASVIESSRPALTENGLAVLQLIEGSASKEEVTLTTVLTHSSGQFFKATSSIPLIDMKGCNAAQNAGASLSYLRRYAYQAIIGQPSEDNDASSNGFQKPEVQAKKPTLNKPAEKQKEAEAPKIEEVAPATPKKSGFRRSKTTTVEASSDI